MSKSTSEQSPQFAAAPVAAPEAIVFDCDGVLVDSEQAWLDVIDLALRKRGLYEPEAVEPYRGITIRDAAERLARASGDSFETAHEEVATGFSDALNGEVPVLPGVREFLGEIAGTLPIAVASNSDRHDLERALAAAHLSQFFPVQVSAEDVERGKPDPALYLLAAERLGVDPSRVIAVEDSPVGSLAATRAGMFVVGINADPDVTLHSNVRFSSMTELAEFFAGLERDAQAADTGAAQTEPQRERD